jgi:hypothetical protein
VYRRIICALSLTAGALCSPFLTTTANAAAPADVEGCSVVFYDVALGQGVEAFCPDEPGTYQVIAQCSNGDDTWMEPGTLATPDSGPSVAECRGVLLFPAHVANYFVVR